MFVLHNIALLQSYLVTAFFFLSQIFYEEDSRFFYRNSPKPQECFIDITPLPSEPVEPDDIEISEFRLDSNGLSVSLNWTLPEVTNGGIRGYDIRITTSPLPPNLDQADNDQLVIERSLPVSQQSYKQLT